MTQPGDALRRIAWTEAFPFTRIFVAARFATGLLPIALGFAAVVLAYGGGRLLDSAWVAAGGGVPSGAFSQYFAGRDGSVPQMLILDEVRQRIERELAPATSASRPVEIRRGPFAVLLGHWQQCFAAGTHAVAGGRLGFGGSPYLGDAGLLSCATAAVHGLTFVASQRPLYALLYAVFVIGVLAYFGGAICRYVAVRVTLDEDLTLEQATGFAGEKWLQLAGAPLLLLAAFIGVSLLMILGGLVGAIPWLGELFMAAVFPLTLMGGVVLAALTVALLAGFPLIWPTIAVEGSDAADGLLKSGSYVRSRPWSAGFYAILLLTMGALALLVARGLAVLVLKLAHSVSRVGVNFFGYGRSSGDEAFGKLDGMWSMPGWGELSLLPSLDGTPFWGRFGLAGELNWSETFCMWMLMIWVFAVVALVAGYLVSFYFSAATGMYLVLRQEVDGVDPREIFYEGPEAEWDALASAPGGATTAAEGAPGGPPPLSGEPGRDI
jgi:hypothetical protein